MELDNNKKYFLGVEGTRAYDLPDERDNYNRCIIVDQSVYDWLNSHDVEINPKGERVYICNNVRYIDLGPKINYKNNE